MSKRQDEERVGTRRPKFPSFSEGMPPASDLKMIPGPFAAAAYQPQAMAALIDHVKECQRYYRLMMSISGPVMISPQLESLGEWGRATARLLTATGLMSLVNKNVSSTKHYVQQRVNVDRRVVQIPKAAGTPAADAGVTDPARWGART